MEIKSSAFKEGENIPSRFTCDNLNISPHLEWTNVPSGTKTFALICDDPDAPSGIWVHWVIFNIPGTVRELHENIPKNGSLPDGTLQGVNDSSGTGYYGPCPPGGTHRYYFKLYALDAILDLKPGITKKVLLKAMESHILEEAHLMGRYKRKS